MIFIEPFAGTLALSRCLLSGQGGSRSPRLESPVAYMGAKNEIGGHILRTIGCRPGTGADRWIWNDLSTIGYAWAVILGPDGARVASILRGWEGEDARALWFRLRDAGPSSDPAAYVAQWLWLQARAASGVPVWWAGGADLVSMDGHGRGPYPAWQATCAPKLLQCKGDQPYDAGQKDPSYHARLLQWASGRIDGAGQRESSEPRLCRAEGEGDPRQRRSRSDLRMGDSAGGSLSACAKGGIHLPPAPTSPATLSLFGEPVTPPPSGPRLTSGGIQSPTTIARRIEALRVAWCGQRTELHRQPAAAFVEGLLPEVRAAVGAGERVVAVLDPPYVGATGYECACPRPDAVAMSLELSGAGAEVAVCEAEPVAELVAAGWHALQMPGRRKPEWITTSHPPRLDALIGDLWGMR